MHVRNLKVFCDVARKQSFSKAAAENGITQSAATQAIQQLESHLEVRLLDRSKRPFVLTSEGEVFLEGCGRIVNQFQALVEEVRSVGKAISGRARVAAIYSIGLSYLPQLEERFTKQFPQAELSLQYGHPEEVYELVQKGLVDFGLVSYPQHSKTVATKHWRNEPMMLVASPKHRLANGSSVQISQLTNLPLVAFAPNLRIRQEIDRQLKMLGVAMKVVAELDNIDSVKHAAQVNSGVAFVPEPTVRSELESGILVGIPCASLSMLRPLGIINRRGNTMGRTARAFLDLVLADAAGESADSTASVENSVESRALSDSSNSSTVSPAPQQATQPLDAPPTSARRTKKSKPVTTGR